MLSSAPLKSFLFHNVSFLGEVWNVAVFHRYYRRETVMVGAAYQLFLPSKKSPERFLLTSFSKAKTFSGKFSTRPDLSSFR